VIIVEPRPLIVTNALSEIFATIFVSCIVEFPNPFLILFVINIFDELSINNPYGFISTGRIEFEDKDIS
jgi:hypothetical protein